MRLLLMTTLCLSALVQASHAKDIVFNCSAKSVGVKTNWHSLAGNDGEWKGTCERAKISYNQITTDPSPLKNAIVTAYGRCEEATYKIPDGQIKLDEGKISAAWTTRPKVVVLGKVSYPIWNESFSRARDGNYIYKITVIDDITGEASSTSIVRGVCFTN